MGYPTKIIYTAALISSINNLSAQEKIKNTKPNIVVFLADDAGMDFGCYGNKNISTPNIDKIAKNGILFKNAFLTAPQSSPSRTSMLSGKFAHTIGTEDLHNGLNAETLILPTYLHRAGYVTASMLKTHWGPNGDKQFDVRIKGDYLPNQGPLSDELFQNYNKFLDENKDKPFFIWVGFIDPHRPYNRNNTEQQNDPKKIQVPPYLVNSDKTKRDMADYYNEISRMDNNIGTMMDELDKRGLTDNTIFVFMSDNGMPFPRCKGTLYDSGIQTPLLFMWKGKITPGTTHSNGMVSSIDLAPTLLDLAGIDIPQDMYGRGFKKLLFDPTQKGSEFIYAERNWHDADEYMRCIRSNKYKLVYNAYYNIPHGTSMDISTSDSWYELKRLQRSNKLTENMKQIFQCPRAMVEIYDLEKDPYELNNVADLPEYREIGEKLAAKLVKWQKDTQDHPWWKRRRSDQNDRITGFPLFKTRPPMWTD
jgi:heparan N-sulfatase